MWRMGSGGVRTSALVVATLATATTCGRLGFEPQASDAAAEPTLDASGDVPESPYRATHNGWLDIRAIGDTTPKNTASPVAARTREVTFAWAPMTITPTAPIDSYELYRGLSPGGPYQRVGTVVVDALPTGAPSFTDTEVASNTTYYYQVRPSVENPDLAQDHLLSAPEPDATLVVFTPPENMALVHRWAANLEVCELLGQAPDRSNNYRCDYTGPGRIGYSGDIGDPPASEAFYDIGAHHFVDQFEMGCNYTQLSSGCPDDGAAPGACLGIGGAAPDNVANAKSGNSQVGNEGDIFYDRGDGSCWIHSGGAWKSAGNGTDSDVAAMSANSPGLPPLVRVSQSQSWNVCKLRSSLGQPLQLLSRKLHLASSAWPIDVSNAEIVEIEAGTAALACNTDLGHQGSVSFDNQVEPAEFASLPSTETSATFVMRTGDPTTGACLSRYGIHNLAGNVWEWTSDQFNATASGTVCSGIPSDLDADNRDFVDVVFSRATGGGAGEWSLALAPKFLPALGLPIDAALPAWYQAHDTATVADHGDAMFMDGATDQVRGTYVGGSTSSGTRAGRYAINVSRPPNQSHERIGFRCSHRISP